MSPEERISWLQDPDNYETYKKAVRNSLSLGLDLQGGMFVTLEIGVDEVIRNLAADPNNPTIKKAITRANQLRQTETGHYVDLFVRALKAIEPNSKLAIYFAGPKTGLTFTSSDDEVISKLKEEVDGAVDRTFNILRTRIDQFGVASPNLQKQTSTQRILIELPGVKDAKRVRTILRSTAKLEFWPTYTIQEAFPYLEKANEQLKLLLGITDTIGQDTTKSQTTAQTDAQKDSIETVEEITTLIGGENTPVTTKKDTAEKDTALMTLEEKRAKFDRENPLFAKLRFPDPNAISPNTPVVGYALISDTAKVNEYLNIPEIQRLFPPDLKFYWTVKPEIENSQYLTLIAIKSNPQGKAPLTGEYIEDARGDFDPQTNKPVVYMNMNSEGARIWKRMTTDYLGKSIAIVLDNYVYTYPVVQNVISNGNSQISGNFTIEEAKDLANILKAGKLPAPTHIVGEEIVGPTLGQDTIEQGLKAFILAFIGVILFMILYYRSSGVIADIALLLNLVFILGIMSALNINLTFPGIAGIVLTMGMAVDANVLIYERIREELENGKPLKGALSEGYQNALSAIIDGNVTTFLTGIILFTFGTGPIRGFAVTLMIGIVTTLISGLLITRLLLDYLINDRKWTTISFGSMAVVRLFKQLQFPFVSKRKIGYIVLLSISILFLIIIFTQGFRLGVDFLGGRQYVVEFKEDYAVDITVLRKDLTAAFDNNMPVVKSIGNKNQFLITTQYLYQSDVEQEKADELVRERLIQGLKTHFADGNPQIVKSSIVGPTIAEDIKRGAFYSVLVSIFVIFFYIFLRFQGWQFGIGALVSLSFNVLFVLGVFSLLGQMELPFPVELDQAFIAALLTIVGYTINDTVIIFDRIRERIQNDKENRPLELLFNMAINETLARTIVTSFTTLLTAIVLFFLGGEVLKAFLLALIIGITIGTLSSIFVASPIALDLSLYRQRKSFEKAKVTKS
jgi:SecD/SecF fusion protein